MFFCFVGQACTRKLQKLCGDDNASQAKLTTPISVILETNYRDLLSCLDVSFILQMCCDKNEFIHIVLKNNPI